MCFRSLESEKKIIVGLNVVIELTALKVKKIFDAQYILKLNLIN